MSGHTEAVVSLAFDPQSDLLVSGSSDQTVRLWDRTDGAAISAIIAGHQGPVWSVALDPERRFLATAGEDGTVSLWNWVVDPRTACELATPYVTAPQMEEYLPARPAPTCTLRS
jgi:WD40 repeat protein